MKKRSILLVLPLLLGVVTGCNNTNPSGVKTIRLSLMNSTNENPGWLAQIEMANKLMEQDGVKIKIKDEIIEATDWNTFATKINANMAGGVGGTIVRMAESHIAGMIEKRQLQELTSLKNELLATNKYDSSAFDGVATKDGKTYGLPTGTQHMVLYYNKDLFDSKSISYPSSDWNNASTFEEIATMARSLTYEVGSNYKNFGISASPALAYAGMYAVNSGGYNIFNDQGEPVINTDPFYEIYEWFDQMIKVDKSMPSTSDTQLVDAINRFKSGNIAMMVDGIWQLHDIIKYTEFNVGVAAIPVLDKQYKSHTTRFTDRFIALRSSRTPTEDQIALKYLMRAEAITELALKSVGGYPVCNECIEDFEAGLVDSKLGNYANTIKEGRNNVVDVPYSSYYNRVDTRINQKMATWLNGDMTSREFVDFMQDSMLKGIAGTI